MRFLNCPRWEGLAIDWSPRLPGGYYCSLRISTKLRNFTSSVASGSSVSFDLASIGPQAASTITSSVLIRKSSLRQALVLSVENYERQGTLTATRFDRYLCPWSHLFAVGKVGVIDMDYRVAPSCSQFSVGIQRVRSKRHLTQPIWSLQLMIAISQIL